MLIHKNDLYKVTIIPGLVVKANKQIRLLVHDEGKTAIE
jgi:hypothetical protein